MKRLLRLLLAMGLMGSMKAGAQDWSWGGDYGRAFFRYQYRNYGVGYSNAPRSNRGFTAQFLAERSINKSVFFQTGLRFLLYQQYFSTTLSFGAFEENYPVIMIPVLAGVKRTAGRFSFSARGGPALGIVPDQFEGRFTAMLYVDQNTLDSITRGKVFRNQGPIAPFFELSLGLEYRLSRSLGVSLRLTGVKGFKTITKYEIYYNNGSGRNDQYAEQWGKGDYAGISLGLAYHPKARGKGNSK
jgi:hypothetical protein